MNEVVDEVVDEVVNEVVDEVVDGNRVISEMIWMNEVVDEVVDEVMDVVVDGDRDGDHQAENIPVLRGRLVFQMINTRCRIHQDAMVPWCNFEEEQTIDSFQQTL